MYELLQYLSDYIRLTRLKSGDTSTTNRIEKFLADWIYIFDRKKGHRNDREADSFK